ncbi:MULTISPECIES: hypothetical protein [unclassified Vibrio]|uniref:hypothetical protein n=1 Tax=unclassified Vibrio TaxID=2614977 RepID=UPI000B8EC32C|nr:MULTISPECIES: hypothetical protein [unclassified Vibrio]NAW90248.1 hypothetical protein [Vibrio sp. V24_P1S3T111]OXX20411.1 hypothetical protein B9J88_14220 [Vibrio sp. V05_P4A8T149]OXX23369.1 hypothetical protein B9J86_07630 [Vibrio sp. V06_P1A73T115]OXX29155.1 hypothetical protein B9J95_14185 [Vibrio sp. V14_P6S14T42]OXX36375.1 hypothetical protein B9J81_06085 [Vibrio sp. V04_P4A5T148]
MTTPIHSLNVDFSHSSEAKELLTVVKGRLSWLSPSSPEFEFLYPIYEQLVEAAELLESLEV